MTLRELVHLAEARQDADWQRTAAVMALLANCHRDVKKHPAPFRPEDIYKPRHARRDTSDVLPGDIGMLKAVFLGSGKGKP